MTKKSTFMVSLILVICLVVGLGGLDFYLRAQKVQMAHPNEAIAEPKSISSVVTLPRPSHVLIVVEENHAYKKIVGNTSAPYMNSLAKKGVLFTNSFAVSHPSEPNYLALFSGATQGVTDDGCHYSFSTPNLATELTKKHLSFAGFSEDLPSVGFNGCSSGLYARKHAPWVSFKNVSSQSSRPLTELPKNLASLPTVSFVIPNLNHDMHNGTIQSADIWLKDTIGPYVKWAETHNSLLIITWDEDDNTKINHIPTIFVGPMVRTGQTSQKITHYSVLRTIEDMYALPLLGYSQNTKDITGIWKTP